MKVGRWVVVTLLLIAATFFAASTRSAGSQPMQATPDGAATVAPTDSATPDVAAGAHHTVKSTDGRVMLLIPDGALPTDVTVASIKITSGGVPLRLNNKPPVFAYRLEPDGLRFSSPAVIQITTNWARDGSMPMLFSVAGDEIEPLDGVLAEADSKSRKLTLTASIAHFSQVVGSEGFQLTIQDPSARTLGDPFSVEAQVKRKTKDQVIKHSSDFQTTLKYNETWNLSGKWYANGPLSPAILFDSPPITQAGPDTFTVNQQFTCKAVSNPVTIRYQASIGVGWTRTTSFKGLTEKTTKGATSLGLTVVSGPFRCLHLVTRFTARFSAAKRTTTYRVFANPTSVGKLTYQWSKEGDSCGTFTPNEDTAEWHHPHIDEGGNCPGQGHHRATIKVTVSHARGATQTVTYTGGSADGTLDEDDFPSYLE
jgi:hypothetical protein